MSPRGRVPPVAAPACSASMHQNEPRRVWEMNLDNHEKLEQRSNRELEPQPIAASRRAEGVTDARRGGFPAWLLALAVAVVGLCAYLLLSQGTIAFAGQPGPGDLWALAPTAGATGSVTGTVPVPATITSTHTATPTVTPLSHGTPTSFPASPTVTPTSGPTATAVLTVENTRVSSHQATTAIAHTHCSPATTNRRAGGWRSTWELCGHHVQLCWMPSGSLCPRPRAAQGMARGDLVLLLPRGSRTRDRCRDSLCCDCEHCHPVLQARCRRDEWRTSCGGDAGLGLWRSQPPCGV